MWAALKVGPLGAAMAVQMVVWKAGQWADLWVSLWAGLSVGAKAALKADLWAALRVATLVDLTAASMA